MDKQKLILIIAGLIFLSLVVLNFLTIFTPEVGFDALWYHLTLPKLWLLKKQWFFPGGLLYYSTMPRLAETLFIPLIKYTGTIGPKFLQFLSGLGTALLVYQISLSLGQKKFYSLLGAFAFYITWLTSWQSGSAYIDLIRTFLETLALWFFVSKKWFKGALLLGLAVGTKWLSLGSLAIYSLVFGPQIIFPALLVASPWFIIAYYYTGNPVYPLFEPFLSHTLPGLSDSIIRIIQAPLLITKPVDDFLTPLAGLFLILSVITFFRSQGLIKKVSAIALLGTVFSIILNPPSSRFLLPFLPALVISAFVFISDQNRIVRSVFNYLLLASFIFILSIRIVTFQKYLPFLTGHQTATAYLVSQKDRLPETFIDTDRYVENNLQGKRILIDKLHNLYYFPFDFDHSSWATPGKVYDYLVTISETEDTGKTLLHTNDVGIQIFKLNHD